MYFIFKKPTIVNLTKRKYKVRLILTDPFNRKTFDIANIAKYRGIKIVICYEGSILKKKLLQLLYSSELFQLREDHFLEDLNSLEEYYSEELVFFPIEENTIIKFYKYISESTSKIKYLLPALSKFNLVRDKKNFSEFCLNNGINVPKEYDYSDLLALNELPSPLIIKPKIGSGSVGIKTIDNMEEFSLLKELDMSEYLIQERLNNSKDILGAFFLVVEGEVISYYGHKRIRTYPPEGGVTVYSKTYFNDELKQQGSELLKKLNWNGIAMIEFLYDDNSNTYKIIELNPRAWGSILLSEYCNANFIINYANASRGKELEKKEFKTKTFIRWVFPWDILSYIKNKGKVKDFWKLNLDSTCYINFTYSSVARGLLFLLVNVFDVNKLKKLYKKVFRK